VAGCLGRVSQLAANGSLKQFGRNPFIRSELSAGPTRMAVETVRKMYTSSGRVSWCVERNPSASIILAEPVPVARP